MTRVWFPEGGGSGVPPLGLCGCGCGRTTKIATENRRGLGHVKGQPLRYLVGHRPDKTRPLTERFWEKVDVRGPDECWPWKANRNEHGYGLIYVRGRGKNVRAARVALVLAGRPIPDELDALHRCDNPPCVNQAHLFAGTQLENVQDMVAKGRLRLPMLRGEDHGNAKLTRAIVEAIRARSAEGVSQLRLAAENGVSPTLIGKVLKLEVWR